ncbi:MAG: 23S rRNA (guanosine(2251)-2'-O)-methyltransferase RlmB [Desulfovibrionales bacterium]|nr:23S rRNA (guanosine(2251)-2'-O)-methyltransferase RlmB [Desulfovibrionales bacterium]
MTKSLEHAYCIPGRKPVLELLATDAGKVDTVFIAENLDGAGEIIYRCRELRVRFRKVKREELDRIFSGNHQGVVARIQALQLVSLSELTTQAHQAQFPVILALDQIQDPGNVGTLARTLYALGGIGLVFPKDRSAFLGPGAIKSAAGTLDKIHLCQVVNLARALVELSAQGFWIYGTGAQEKSTPLFSSTINFPAVLVLGNEDKGMRQGVAKHCHEILSIPMHKGFDSLNVAQAGAMVMGEMLRQHLGSI